MILRATIIAFIGLLCSLTLQVSSGQDGITTALQKDAKKDVGKKFEVPKDAIEGEVKAVDMAKATFTVTLKSKKDRTFAVDKATEFWGPKGGDRGTGPDGLKDDCMAVGYQIRVLPTKDGKTAKDVYLPVRKAEKKDKK